MHVLSLFSQRYKLSLIPMLVRGVPSMHICLDMIAELLALPQLEQTRSPALYGSRHRTRASAQALAADGRLRARSDSVSSTASTSTSSGLEVEAEMDWEPSANAPSPDVDPDAMEEIGGGGGGGLPSPQVFAIHLAAHLSTQYAVPKAQSVARFCFDAIDTFLTCALPTVSYSYNLLLLVTICTLISV